MRIKRGDNVKVVAGKDKGKSGKIIQVFPKLNKVVVEGTNVMHKYVRGKKAGEGGQKLEYSAPLHASNVRLICPKCSKPTRLGTLELKEGEGKTRKVRSCKKCKEAID